MHYTTCTHPGFEFPARPPHAPSRDWFVAGTAADTKIHRFTDSPTFPVFIRLHPWLNSCIMVRNAMILAAGYSTACGP